MAPWVFVASNNDELKEWMKVLTVAASAGKESSTQATKSEEKTPVCHKAPAMQAIVEEEQWGGYVYGLCDFWLKA